jgi:NAD(P)-dependent dehydrogenase (short-subunit alcohol dehydrogenase family)
MRPQLRDQVVVITGASSGAGRATALRFAREGAGVVLAARGRRALDSALAEVERAGGRGLAVQMDVGQWADVQQLARETVERFGRIDTWINNAAVSEYATVEQMEPDEIEQIIRVNLLGQMYGSRAALMQMRTQAGGVIINVASALGMRSVPLQSAYSASKHGVKGFTEALRLEAKREHPQVEVCLVLPSSMNTPLFSHARSRIGVQPQPIPPVYDPNMLAETLARLALKPQAHVVAGGSGKLFAVVERINPGLLDWYLLKRDRGVRQQKSDRPDDGIDNLEAPLDEEGATRGEYGEDVQSVSVYTSALEEHPRRKALVLGGAALGAAALTWKLAR